MRATSIARALLGLSLAATAAAQTTKLTLPIGAGVASNLVTTEGSASLHLPGGYAPSRTQVIYRGADFKLASGGMALKGVAFRRDGLRTTNYRAHRFKLSVTLSQKGVALPVHASDRSFAANEGSDKTVVATQKLVDWPAAGKPATAPAPFAVNVVFDKPYTLLPGNNLCVDLLSESTTGARQIILWYCDAEAFATYTSKRGSTRLLGRGCPFAFQTRASSPPLDGEAGIDLWSYTRVTGTQSAPAILFAGDSNTNWGGIALPLDLGPLGAPGCRISTSVVLTAPGLTIPGDARGTVRWRLPPLPKLAAFAGQIYYGQVGVIDKAANALGLRMSSLVELKFGQVSTPLPARTVYHSGPTLGDKPTKGLDSGLVLQLVP